MVASLQACTCPSWGSLGSSGPLGLKTSSVVATGFPEAINLLFSKALSTIIVSLLARIVKVRVNLRVCWNAHNTSNPMVPHGLPQDSHVPCF